MKRNLKILHIFIITIGIFMINMLYINKLEAALYKSRGDEIPVATIEYDPKDNVSVFPESYKEALKKLKEAHPNWTFMAVYTNLDWAQTIKHESYEINEGISLVPMSYASSWKKDGKNYFQDGSWVTASKAAVAYALDPRNYLAENTIFQFESLSCVEGIHTVEAVEKVLVGTDLETKYTKDESGNKVKAYPTYININNITINMQKTYADIIYEAGRDSGVSPIHIATRIIQETGGKLANGSICGTNEGYLGYYNFFNIGAVPGEDGNSAVTNGLITAKNNGWDSPEKSIKAGALTLYNSYIKYGQDTVYFQKFDVSNSKGNATMLYAFQYMTNILAPASEAKLTYNAYSALGILDSSFVFYIPVYENRTIEKAPMPGADAIDDTKIENDKPEEEEEKEEEKTPIKVTKISTKKSSYSLAKGKSAVVDVVVLPENADDKTYTASVDNKEIVKVEKNKITALKAGKAKVTFKTKDGGFKAVVNIEVTEKEEFTINKEKINVTKENYIIDIEPGTSLKDITSCIKASDDIKIEGKNISNEVLKDESLVGNGTSIVITSSDSKELAKYTIIIKGDVNGDSKISAADYVLVKNSIMGNAQLSEIQNLATDVNSDKKTSAADYVLIKNHIMGTSNLYE